jgi:hypothetical protein
MESAFLCECKNSEPFRAMVAAWEKGARAAALRSLSACVRAYPVQMLTLTLLAVRRKLDLF